MGFLKIFGIPLSFIESIKYHKMIKDNFVNFVIRSLKSDNENKNPLFGYEFEFHKIKIDDEKKHVYLDLTAQDDINKASTFNLKTGFYICHEYGGWMIEAIHDDPFPILDITKISQSVNNLYQYINNKFGKDSILSFSSFPLLGCGEYYEQKLDSDSDYGEEIEEEESKEINKIIEEDKKEKKKVETKYEMKKKEKIELNSNPYTKSIFLNDNIINKHPRFGTLAKNIRERRGKKVEIKIPLFKDINTNLEVTPEEPYKNFVYMDAMGFGMGNCCVQVTVGTCCLGSALYLYDELIPFTPILLAISSNTPLFKGKLTDYDNRWSSISQSVDDRTDEERDPKSEKYIYKSRYSSCYSYISNCKYMKDYMNDYPKMPINKEYYKKFTENGLEHNLAMHFCNLLTRDPLVIFSEKINIKDENDMSHFENINSTNWNALRFKIPRPSDKDLCFKVEVRPLDLEITPFENTAMITLIMLLYGMLVRMECDFIIPISLVDENFERAYQNDAINKKKFWWRINSFKSNEIKDYICQRKSGEKDGITYEEDIKNNIKELTINEIFNGCKEYNYLGILHYLKLISKEMFKAEKYCEKYLGFLSKRASGELWTDAKYIRNFVKNHPKYKRDSIITEEINYDLIKHILKIQNNEIKPEELFGEIDF